jgi:hypothetical protein
MKKNKLINNIFFALGLSLIVFACSEDEGDGKDPGGVSFTGIATTSEESAAATVTIPFRDGSVSEDDIIWGGTATVGEDYTVAGVTDEGIQLTIINDTDLEPNETIRIQIPSSANSIHTVTIGSDCTDEGNLQLEYFKGTWSTYEYYCGLGVTDGTCDYGPYETVWVQDETDPTIFRTTNFYDSGRTGYIKFNLANGTVYFPDQQPLPDTGAPTLLTLSSGVFSIDDCDGATMTIDLNYDGGDWIYYLERVYPY